MPTPPGYTDIPLGSLPLPTRLHELADRLAGADRDLVHEAIRALIAMRAAGDAREAAR